MVSRTRTHIKARQRVDHPDFLTEALKNLERGFQVFQLQPKSKEPYPSSRGFYDASSDRDRVSRWWKQRPAANLAIRTGAESGIFVLDQDGKSAGKWLATKDLPSTLTAKTRHGRHYYFKHPGGKVKNRTDKNPLGGVDGLHIRGDGGYVVAPPSIHPDGGSYEWLTDAPIAGAPQWLLDLLNDPEPERKPRHFAEEPATGTREEAYATAALQRELETLSRAAEGSRNDTLNSCAYSLGQLVGGNVLSESHVEDCLLATAMHIGLTEREAARTIKSGLQDGKQSPRGVPADELTRSNGKRQEAKPLEQKTSKKDAPKIAPVADEWSEAVADTYLYTSNNQWWEYNAGVWSMVDEPYIQRSVSEFARPRWKDSLEPKHINKITDMARLKLLLNIQEMGGKQSLIPFRNGVYDRETGTLLKHNPKHLLTRQLPFNYDAAAICPKFEKFLRQILITEDGQPCQEWIDVMQEWFGYLLLPDASAQTAMVWTGTGANGKGVLTKVLEAFVGRDYSTAVAVDQLKDAYHRADLFGKMLGTTGDLDKDDLRHAAGWFKAIVGGDTISARYPAGRVFHFVPTLRLVISCNDLPDTTDTSYGYFRRLLIIDFRYNVAEEQKIYDLPEQLIAEMPGIFNWALLGLERFERNGRKFTVSDESKAVLNEYQLAQDPVARFIAERCEVGNEDNWEWAEDLYDEFKKWCRGQGFREKDIPSDKSFGMRLNGRRVPRAYKAWDASESRSRNCRKGIRIRSLGESENV